MRVDTDRALDFEVHRLLFGQADSTMVPRYSTNFTACLLIDVRLVELGWTIAATERGQSLTTVTLRHADGRQVTAEGIDQYEATCKAAVRMLT